jgi:predicted nucleotidyltransferase
VTVDELLTALRAALEHRADVRFAILFGSALRDPTTAHDVDLAVSFTRPTSLLEAGALANDLDTATGCDVDLVDLDDASTLLRWEIFRTGRLVTARDRSAWLDFMARVPSEWADLEPYYQLESEGLRRALLEDPRWSASISSAPKSAV